LQTIITVQYMSWIGSDLASILAMAQKIKSPFLGMDHSDGIARFPTPYWFHHFSWGCHHYSCLNPHCLKAWLVVSTQQRQYTTRQHDDPHWGASRGFNHVWN
jgi:hypothetical protein